MVNRAPDSFSTRSTMPNYALERSVTGLAWERRGRLGTVCASGASAIASRGPLNADVRWRDENDRACFLCSYCFPKWGSRYCWRFRNA